MSDNPYGSLELGEIGNPYNKQEPTPTYDESQAFFSNNNISGNNNDNNNISGNNNNNIPATSSSGTPHSKGKLYPNQPQLFLDPTIDSYNAYAPHSGPNNAQNGPNGQNGQNLTQNGFEPYAPSEFEVLFEYAGYYDGPHSHETMQFRPNDTGSSRELGGNGDDPDSDGSEKSAKSAQNGPNNDDNSKEGLQNRHNKQHRTAQMTLSSQVFAALNFYSAIEKPSYISALLHFRTRQVFMKNDPKLSGFIETQALMAEVPKICQHLDRDMQQLVLNQLKDMLKSGIVQITVSQFYLILATQLGVLFPRNNSSTLQYAAPPVQAPSSTEQRRRSLANDKKEELDTQLDNIKNMRRRSQFANSVVGEQDINTIAQYENSQFHHKAQQGWGQCCAGWIICPIAIHRFPFIATVSAKFGSTYVKLFQFIASLMWLNFIMGAITLLLLVKGQMGFPWASMTEYPISRYVAGVRETFMFIPKRPGFFFGQGLEQSFLFYSDWYSDPFEPYLGKLQLSLLWTILPMLLFFVSMIFVLSHLSKSAANLMEDSEKLVLTVFSFDHRPKTANNFKLQGLHFKSTLYSLTSLLRERQFLQQNKQFFGNQMKLRVRRFFGQLLNLIALGCCCAAIIFLTINEQSISRTISEQLQSSLLGSWAVPLLLSLLKLIIPYIVKFCVWIEARDALGTFRHTSTRIFICKVFFIFVVLFQTQNSKITVSDVDRTVTCRQTITAVMLYKMLASDIVMDVAIELGVSLLFYIWNLIYYKGCGRERIPQLGNHPTYKELDEHLYKSAIVETKYDIYRGEFLAVECLIDMLYTQILIWVGLPFSPVMAFMGGIYFLFQYVTRMTQLLGLSRMPKFSVPQSIQTNLINIFLSISLACAILSYTVFFSTNVTCGPHLFNPQGTNGNSPAAGLVEQIYKLPQAVTVIINLLGSPIILLCFLGILGFIAVNYRLIFKQYSKDSKQLSMWLAAERSQIKMLRKKFSLRGTNTTQFAVDIDQPYNTTGRNSSSVISLDGNGAVVYSTATFGGGDMTPQMVVQNAQKERLKASQKTQQTVDFQRDEQLLRRIQADKNDVLLLTQRAKSLFVDFVEELPDSMAHSFQHYCVTILWIDDITPLLMMEKHEIVTLLSQWNPVLQEDSPLVVFFIDLLTRYRCKMLL